MDIESLVKAFKKSPDNSIILNMLMQSLVDEEDYEAAYFHLKEFKGNLLGEGELAAEVCLKNDKPEEALTYLEADRPEDLIMKAKIYLKLMDYKQGLAAYKSAVSKKPTLEDPKLEKALSANVKEVLAQGSGGNVVGFRVITNENKRKDQYEEDERYYGFMNSEEQPLPDYLTPKKSNVKFKDVGGLDEVKKQIHRKIILPFHKPSLFEKFKKRAGGGVLMYGPPGCGKTLLARATAGECEANFYNIAISDVLDMYIGQSEKKLAQIFEEARKNAPSVIFFDELEALAGKRSYNSHDSSSSKMVSQFLSEMDGFGQNNQGVLILGATNVPWSIDPAFRRPGRFDRVQFVPPPDREAREAILHLLITGRPVEGEIDFKTISKATSGFSGADLSNLIETACDFAIEDSIEKGEEQSLNPLYLKQALEEIRPTTSEWLTTARNYAKYSNEGGQYDEVIDFLKKYGK